MLNSVALCNMFPLLFQEMKHLFKAPKRFLMGTLENKIPTLEEAKEYIYSIDFSQIINLMVSHLGWLKKDAIDTRDQYSNFLYLKFKYFDKNYTLVPTIDIDEFFHLHILDTKKFREDSNFLFKKPIEHYPYYGIDGKSTITDLNNSFNNTQELYYNEYSCYMTHTRSKHFKIIYSLMKMLELP